MGRRLFRRRSRWQDGSLLRKRPHLPGRRGLPAARGDLPSEEPVPAQSGRALPRRLGFRRRRPAGGACGPGAGGGRSRQRWRSRPRLSHDAAPRCSRIAETGTKAGFRVVSQTEPICDRREGHVGVGAAAGREMSSEAALSQSVSACRRPRRPRRSNRHRVRMPGGRRGSGEDSRDTLHASSFRTAGRTFEVRCDERGCPATRVGSWRCGLRVGASALQPDAAPFSPRVRPRSRSLWPKLRSPEVNPS